MKSTNTANRSAASELLVIRLGIATLTVFGLLAGAALVTANAKIPVVAQPQPLVNLTGVAVSPDTSLPLFKKHSGFNTDKVTLLAVQQLSADQLRNNALNRLRSLPFYYSTAQRPDQPVNVNAFLMATGVSNDSKLAELQMQPVFVEFDSKRFVANSVNRALTESDSSTRGERLGAYDGVGFPHIETNDRPDSTRYKPYKQLLSINSKGNGQIVPHVACMGLSPESVAQRAEKYDQQIFNLAVKHNVSASLVKAVVAKESCYNAKARSHVGAIGLMQLMPETAKWLKVSNPDNPQQNLAAGVRYLAQLRKRFGSNELALAAYNAGPGNVERYNGIPPFAETQQYVTDVMYFYRGYVATTRFVNALNTI